MDLELNHPQQLKGFSDSIIPSFVSSNPDSGLCDIMWVLDGYRILLFTGYEVFQVEARLPTFQLCTSILCVIFPGWTHHFVRCSQL